MDTPRLREFIHRFFGYGSWSAPLWFIGMEEAGTGSSEEMDQRLAAWKREHDDELVDLHEFQAELPGAIWSSARTPLQPTWSKLIRATLCAQGEPCSTDHVRAFQRERLGRRNDTAALIELFPLPCQSTRVWPHSRHGIDELASRKFYIDSFKQARIDTIRARVAMHQPRAVVFYGKAYRMYWEAIAGAPFHILDGFPFETAIGTTTSFILAPHPIARRVKNEHFCSIGKYVRDRGAT